MEWYTIITESVGLKNSLAKMQINAKRRLKGQKGIPTINMLRGLWKGLEIAGDRFCPAVTKLHFCAAQLPI